MCWREDPPHDEHFCCNCRHMLTRCSDKPDPQCIIKLNPDGSEDLTGECAWEPEEEEIGE
jgi:hypothetical protein